MDKFLNTGSSPNNRVASEVINIRPASPGDAESIANCLAVAFQPYRIDYTPGAFHDTILSVNGIIARMGKMTILVAENEMARIVGTIAFAAVSLDEGHIRGMAVVPDFQGKGVARQLLAAAEMSLHTMGCSRATLDTTKLLERAILFYTRNGYRATGTVKDFFGMPLFEYMKILSGEIG